MQVQRMGDAAMNAPTVEEEEALIGHWRELGGQPSYTVRGFFKQAAWTKMLDRFTGLPDIEDLEDSLNLVRHASTMTCVARP